MTQIINIDNVKFVAEKHDYDHGIRIAADGFNPAIQQRHRFMMGVIHKRDLPKLIEVLQQMQKTLEE